jgi:hypothetical protein
MSPAEALKGDRATLRIVDAPVTRANPLMFAAVERKRGTPAGLRKAMHDFDYDDDGNPNGYALRFVVFDDGSMGDLDYLPSESPEDSDWCSRFEAQYERANDIAQNNIDALASLAVPVDSVELRFTPTVTLPPEAGTTGPPDTDIRQPAGIIPGRSPRTTNAPNTGHGVCVAMCAVETI